ncbi:MAG: carotenoid biosynthesis protein [Candidatus Nanopelagicales bacterium]
MSIRYYSGPHAEGRHWPHQWSLLPWGLAAVTIVGQILWILTDSARDAITVTTVFTFALASFVHAWQSRGWMWAVSYFAIAAGVGLIAEAVGTASGFPFGAYDYADSLGLKVLGVPIVIPLAWAMMAYPALLATRALVSSRLAVALIGAWLLMSWDFFLDPQMVSEGHWSWENSNPSLPGIDGIPITNFLGWFLTAFIMMWLLSLLPQHRSDDGVPTLMLLWVFGSNVMANLVFFDRPWVALWGGVAMGIVVVPWAWKTWIQRP